MVTLTPLRKEEKKKEKNEETKPIFEVHISEIPGATKLKFEMWGTDGGGHLHSKNCRFCTSIMMVHTCENHIIVLPGNILTGVAHRLFGPHDTLLCVLIAMVCV